MHEPDNAEPLSKTKRKKQMLALQDLGKILVELPAAQLKTIPLPALLHEAVTTARQLKNHEAKRRQLQYIGKLMRHIDAAPIHVAIKKIQMKTLQSKADFHLVEKWRDRLV